MGRKEKRRKEEKRGKGKETECFSSGILFLGNLVQMNVYRASELDKNTPPWGERSRAFGILTFYPFVYIETKIICHFL
jgi:hypothetical protein